MNVVLTRERGQNDALAEALREQGGFNPISFPCIDFEALPADPALLSAQYDWLIFSSQTAVYFYESALRKIGLTAIPRETRVAAQGDATAAAFKESFGRDADLVPFVKTSEGLAQALCEAGIAGKQALFPCAEKTRGVITRTLEEAGTRICIQALYRTVCAKASAEQLAALRALPAKECLVLFYSPSAFEYCHTLTGSEFLRAAQLISIGPVTSTAIKAKGYAVAAEAPSPSLSAVIGTLRQL